MAKRPLKRSLEYQSRIRLYAENLAERYRVEIAEAFLDRIVVAEKLLSDNHLAGTDSPYLLAGQQVVLKELYIDSGPVKYFDGFRPAAPHQTLCADAHAFQTKTVPHGYPGLYSRGSCLLERNHQPHCDNCNELWKGYV